jgi:peptidoglycan DL-endopeptidase LytE
VRRVLLVVASCLMFLVVASTGAFSASTTHKVKSGDNLYTIAKKYRVSVDKLKSWNSLENTKLKLGQQLVVKKDATIGKTAKKEKGRIQADTTVTENDGEFVEYRTKKGDTLDKIAQRFNIDKDDLIESNSNLKDRKLKPGRIVLIPKIEDDGDEVVVLSNRPSLKEWKSGEEKYMLVKVAKSFMGAPYKYGGESVRGLDCSAYVKKIYDIFDVQLPRSAREQFHSGAKITREELAVGDLVFFKTKRYAKHPTHVGIYIGEGNFIHSSSGHSRVGVKIDALATDFYTKTYVGAVRVKRAPDDSAADLSKNPPNSTQNS